MRRDPHGSVKQIHNEKLEDGDEERPSAFSKIMLKQTDSGIQQFVVKLLSGSCLLHLPVKIADILARLFYDSGIVVILRSLMRGVCWSAIRIASIPVGRCGVRRERLKRRHTMIDPEKRYLKHPWRLQPP